MHTYRSFKTQLLVKELQRKLNVLCIKRTMKAYQALDEIEKIRALIAKIEKESYIKGALPDVQNFLDNQERKILEQVRKKTF